MSVDLFGADGREGVEVARVVAFTDLVELPGHLLLAPQLTEHLKAIGVSRLEQAIDPIFKLLQFEDLSFDLDDADFVHLLHHRNKLKDLVDPAIHRQAEDALSRDAFVPVDHLVLHPDVAAVHFCDQIDVCLRHRPNVELLHRLEKVLLLDLSLDFRPDFVQ